MTEPRFTDDESSGIENGIWRAQDLKAHGDAFSVLATTDRTQLAVMTLQPGESSGEYGNGHSGTDQWLLVLEGSGEVTIAERTGEIFAGDLVMVPAPEKHQFRCTGREPLRTISIYGPVAYPPEI